MTIQAHPSTFDVAVIGGGAAGLSGAITLARARRSVIVIDDGTPRNARATGVHGFLGHDGISPSTLLETGRSELETFGGIVVGAQAAVARRRSTGFEVTLDDGRTITARRLLITTGLTDELPDVRGVRERFGRDVLHCPYCHGWEVRDQAIGILATTAFGVHQALLFRQWSSDVVLFLNTAPALTAEQAEQLAAGDIRVVTGTVDSLQITDDHLTGVRMNDGSVVACQAVTVMPRMVARSKLLTGLGLSTTQHPLGAGEYIAADATGMTGIAGVWAAGNVSNLMAQVVTAAAEGVAAGAAINSDLIALDNQHALAIYRRTRSAAALENLRSEAENAS
ncbi:MAG: thioredoxin reductase [Pseudonocardiales bacterium]|nr:thioredoxin reductase [Pseudonocardiales bacterium]